MKTVRETNPSNSKASPACAVPLAALTVKSSKAFAGLGSKVGSITDSVNVFPLDDPPRGCWHAVRGVSSSPSRERRLSSERSDDMS